MIVRDAWIGWTAGIIDGEGTVSIVPRKRSDRSCRFDGYLVKVMIGNTDRAMVERLAALWGGSIYDQKFEMRTNRAHSHIWTVSALNARRVLESVLPYLITKHSQAVVAIALQERISSGEGMIGEPRCRRSGISEEEISIRTRLYEKIKELNVKPGVRQWQSAVENSGYNQRPRA